MKEINVKIQQCVDFMGVNPIYGDPMSLSSHICRFSCLVAVPALKGGPWEEPAFDAKS